MLRYPILNILPLFIHRWEIQTYLHRTSFPQECLHKERYALVRRVDRLHIFFFLPWHYSPVQTLASSTILPHSLLSSAFSFHPQIPKIRRSRSMLPSHRVFGLPVLSYYLSSGFFHKVTVRVNLPLRLIKRRSI
jgi:hypothetical protein